eukprot:TRINITY_DN3791_c0_g1_i1.p1 TRINITY_DN3791_c0_g1~~TRINITY_DN3791_c0_g1_i1.p1  ORF type:complete len:405 (+),score=100.11 TRINITY_DN3791_c0_g1_i1:138-1352(+)
MGDLVDSAPHLKDLQILETLGTGSYGSVYKAFHKPTGKMIALKKIQLGTDLQNILTEINFMKSITSPYIVAYYGSFIEQNELWIMMEYCGAGSVADMIKIVGRGLTEDQISVVIKYLLNGLAVLHSKKKIHRDVKAGNILFTTEAEGKLADFGVSGQLTDTVTKRTTVIGTPFWMAPEVILETGYDQKADIWSTGITCIELAETKPPYYDIHPMRAIFIIPSKPPATLQDKDKWSSDFHDFIAKCLTKEPENRPSAEELLKHPFVQGDKRASMVTLIQEVMDKIKQVGSRESALGLDSEDNLTDDAVSEMVSSRMGGDNDDDDDDEADASGTLVLTDDVEESDQYTPAFQSVISRNKMVRKTTSDNYENLSLEQLHSEIDQINKQMEQELQLVRMKYESKNLPS